MTIFLLVLKLKPSRQEKFVRYFHSIAVRLKLLLLMMIIRWTMRWIPLTRKIFNFHFSCVFKMWKFFRFFFSKYSRKCLWVCMFVHFLIIGEFLSVIMRLEGKLFEESFVWTQLKRNRLEGNLVGSWIIKRFAWGFHCGSSLKYNSEEFPKKCFERKFE